MKIEYRYTWFAHISSALDDGTHAKTEGGPQASKFFFAKTLSGTCKFDQIFAKKSFTLSLGEGEMTGSRYDG